MDLCDKNVMGEGCEEVGGKLRVRIDLTKLTPNELHHLDAGIASEVYRRNRNQKTGRTWEVPGHAVKVFRVK